MDDSQIDELIGPQGFAALVGKFYRRIPGDPLLAPMYPRDAAELAAAEARLAGFLRFRFGGPETYIAERGHPRLRIRHAPFRITQAERDRWMELMTASLAECDFPAAVNERLTAFFEESASFLINAEG